MSLKKNKFVIRKFDGDTSENYAVFRKADVKNKGNIIFWGQAQPIVCGLNRRSAEYYRSRLDQQFST